MYEIKNLLALKILQKARELGDNDLSNELLITQMLKHDLQKLKQNDTKNLGEVFTTLINAKEKAKMSNK
ncbi:MULTISPECIES: hypothetical protein [unclassified Campylobacter]|uniref:hypothetical protein n=1 Tax=unclassified Campylobacter TaxID=2593542 RepID=UPI000EA94322|nr:MULTISPECIES: hypothetical protein [unclassified Campylobacter]QOR00755.1 hypothetical protein A0083_05740 [Campylobacter sp. 2014D-0216]RKO64085.1 hypothetical protein CKA54_07290 [Campylobacter sp. P255]